LKNEVTRAAAFSGPVVTVSDLSPQVRAGSIQPPPLPMSGTEFACVLAWNGWNERWFEKP